MARGVNKVILVGNLGDDPELKYTGDGTAVCNMSLATNESYTDGDGNQVQQTEWHDVVTWGRLAEVCNEYLQKGSQVYFEGKLQTRSWEDRDGKTRYSTDVKAQDMMFLDGAGNGSSQGASRQGGSSQGGSQRGDAPTQSGSGGQPAGRGSPQGEQDTFEPEDDGLPF